MNDNDINKYQKLLDKLKLARPVPEKTQKYALKSGNRNLKVILKKTGYYSILFGILLMIYRLFRNLGIQATFLKGKIFLSVVAVNIAAAAVVSGQYIADKIVMKEPQSSVASKDISDDEMGNRLATGTVENVPVKEAVPSFMIGIQAFSGDSEKVKIITGKIRENLSEAIGRKNVTVVKSDKKAKLDRVLMGSVRTFGDTGYITARIINVRDSSVEHVFSEEYTSDDELGAACVRISKNIAEKLKK